MNKKAIGFIVAVVAIIVVITILTESKPAETYSPQYGASYSNPYGGSQGVILPPADFSGSYSDDTFDYGSGGQTCTACYGSGSCSICNGTGQYSMYGNDLDDCSGCYGSGICTICGGDGVY